MSHHSVRDPEHWDYLAPQAHKSRVVELRRACDGCTFRARTEEVPGMTVALVLGGWLGPLVILAAATVGTIALRAVDRATTRLRARRRERTAVPFHPDPRSLTQFERMLAGQRARWDDDTAYWVDRRLHR